MRPDVSLCCAGRSSRCVLEFRASGYLVELVQKPALPQVPNANALEIDPDKLARVAGQFITPNGNQVYPVQINGRTVFVTIPED
jgi:hypothetical protein